MSDSDIVALEELRQARQPTRSRRPWYRLHLSTLVVMLLVLTVLVLIMVPGHTTYVLGGGTFFGPQVDEQEHGWPLVHAERVFVSTHLPNGRVMHPEHPLIGTYFDVREDRRAADEGRTTLRVVTAPRLKDGFRDPGEPGWLSACNWPFSGRIVAVYPPAVGLNVAAAVVICGVVGGAYEWWRRGRNRLWQFHLRDLLLLALVVSAGLGWWRVLVAETAREAELVDTLESFGFTATRRSCAPVWLQKLVGPGNMPLLRRVESLSGPDIRLSMAVTPPREIEVLCQSASALRHLRALDLVSADDAAVAEVAELDSLERLCLWHPYVTDRAFQSIQRMGNLEELGVVWWGGDQPQPQITDAAIKRLSALDNLRVLHLASHSGLKLRITDAGLVHLLQLPHLERLTLTGTDVTDDAVVHLRKTARLRELDIQDTLISDAGAEELRRALPNTRIQHSTRAEER